MNKKKITSIVIVIVVLSVGLIGFNQFADNSSTEPVVEVNEYVVKSNDIIINFLADGNISIPMMEQNFQVNGVIMAINFAEGDTVKKGDIIAQLDNRELINKIDQAKLNLSSEIEKATIDQNDVRLKTIAQNNDITQLRANLAAEKATQVAMLALPGAYAEVVVDLQNSKVKDIENAIELAVQNLQGMTSNESTLSDISVAVKKLEIQSLELELENTYLKANIDGVIANINGDLNKSITTTTSFVTIIDQTSPYVDVEVSEMDIHLVSVGQKAYIEFESDFSTPYVGIVESIGLIPQIDSNNIVTYHVTIALQNYPDSIRSGLTVLSKLVLKEKLDVLTIPNNSVTIADNQQFVTLKTETEQKSVKIQTGLTDGIDVEVLSGLNAGDRLLIQNIKK